MRVIGTIAQVAGTSLGEAFSRGGVAGFLVLALLVVLSLASWSIIFWKFWWLQRSRKKSRAFLELFRRSRRFSEVATSLSRLRASPLVGLFEAGYAEIESQVSLGGGSESSEGFPRNRYRLKSISSLERTLRRALAVELAAAQRGLAVLATTAAAAPFIGLFGTVWGIMRAFEDIGRTGSTSLVAVAPGIAEALVNTAAGLTAAIPALMAFNYFSLELRRVRALLEDFLLEFLNLAERNFT
jgi:biopolymer transport protein TolQ